MTFRQLMTAALLGSLLGALLLFPAAARAKTNTGEETDPAHDRDAALLITSPLPRSAVTAGETLKITVVVNKPYDGYNGLDVAVATAALREAPDSFILTSKLSYLPAGQQKDGTYLVAYHVPADYSGWLSLMPEDTGDGLFTARAGHYVLVEVKPPQTGPK